MHRLHTLPAVACAVLLVAGAFACSSSGTPAGPTDTPGSGPGSGGSGGSGGSVGSLAIHITDSPFSDAKALLVTFDEVTVHSANPGDWKTVPFASGSSRTCDLKKLNGATDILGVGSLPAGKYTQVRLNVSRAVIYFDAASAGTPCAPQIAAPAGESAPVEIPSGEVKLNNEFTITSAATTMLLDFDGDKSIRQTGNGNKNSKYMMSPVIRVVSVQ
jgi:hypothetical protein